FVKTIRERAEDSSRHREDLITLVNIAAGNRETVFYLFSLSMESDQLSQWRAYCNDGGVSIEFDKDGLANLTGGSTLGQVEYDPVEQQATYKSVVDEIVNVLEEVRETKQLSKIGRDSLITSLANSIVYASTLKHHSFKEEQEWRVIAPQDD